MPFGRSLKTTPPCALGGYRSKSLTFNLLWRRFGSLLHGSIVCIFVNNGARHAGAGDTGTRKRKQHSALEKCRSFLHRLAGPSRGGWGYLQPVVRALKIALITAYLAARVDAGVGYLLSKCSTQHSEKKAAFCCGFDLQATNFQRPDGPKAPHS